MTTSTATLLLALPVLALLGFGDASGNMAGVLFWSLLMIIGMFGALGAMGVRLPSGKRAVRLTARTGNHAR